MRKAFGGVQFQNWVKTRVVNTATGLLRELTRDPGRVAYVPTMRLTAAISKDGEWFVAQCLEVDIASQGAHSTKPVTISPKRVRSISRAKTSTSATRP